ncbi:hypothetical protein J437_LFUL003996, partial [Ladona fulva]
MEKAAEGRNWLGLARHNLTSASLGILANYKKRLSLVSLLTALHTIKTLHKSEEKVQELLQGGVGDVEKGPNDGANNYVGAIRLLLECQAAAASFAHFSCVEALSVKLQDTLEMAEEQLDVALAKVCVNFNEEDYSRIQEAWHLLGKTQMAVDQMQMHVSTAVHANAAMALSAYICRNMSNPSPLTCTTSSTGAKTNAAEADHYHSDIQHMQYKELC